MVKPEYKVTGHRLLSKGIVGGGGGLGGGMRDVPDASRRVW